MIEIGDETGSVLFQILMRLWNSQNQPPTVFLVRPVRVLEAGTLQHGRF